MYVEPYGGEEWFLAVHSSGCAIYQVLAVSISFSHRLTDKAAEPGGVLLEGRDDADELLQSPVFSPI